MEELLDDYKRRLKTIEKEIRICSYQYVPNSDRYEKISRLETKASCYRTIISELEREIKKDRLFEHSKTIELLDKYSLWLTKNNYMDTDWKDEEPFAIDEFMKTLKS